MFVWIISHLLFSIIFIQTAHGERIKAKMYENLDGSLACFRRMNATDQVGCSSKRGGSVGAVHYVRTQPDFDFILHNGTASAYIPLIPTALLNDANLARLEQASKFIGLVVYADATRPTHYSHEDQCPNEGYNLAKTCEGRAWNRDGTGLLRRDITLPIVFLNDEQQLINIRECWAKFNNFSYEMHADRSLCALEMDTFMYATTNTPTCLRRSDSALNLNPVKFCDPLGGKNIYAPLFPWPTSGNDDPDKSYVVVAARMDTTSMFHDVYPGAIAPLSGIVTLMATAELLKRMVTADTGNNNNNDHQRNVLFVLFNGEAYDYIGSQRMAYDMENGDFPDPKHSIPPLHLDDISLFIELSQLSNRRNVYVHTLEENAKFTTLINRLQTYTKAIKFNPVTDGVLPPASVQSFLRVNRTLDGVVIADHRDAYTNRYYNSIYDNATNLDYVYYNVTHEDVADDDNRIPLDSIQSHVANLSNALARTLYWDVVGVAYNGSLNARLDLIDELFNCYLLDPNCRVHQAVQRKRIKEVAPYYSFYIGVSIVPNMLNFIIGLALGWLTGDVVHLPLSQCINDPNNPLLQYYNMSKSLHDLNTTECYRVTMNFTEALSPAFLIDNYDWSSGKYSSWTESTWKDFSLRMLLMPSLAHEIFTVTVGVAVFVASTISVYFVNKRASIMFPTPNDCSPTNC